MGGRNFLYYIFWGVLVGNIIHVLKKKKFFAKMKKKVSSRPFLTHPAVELKTGFFLSLALEQQTRQRDNTWITTSPTAFHGISKAPRVH